MTSHWRSFTQYGHWPPKYLSGSVLSDLNSTISSGVTHWPRDLLLVCLKISHFHQSAVGSQRSSKYPPTTSCIWFFKSSLEFWTEQTFQIQVMTKCSGTINNLNEVTLAKMFRTTAPFQNCPCPNSSFLFNDISVRVNCSHSPATFCRLRSRLHKRGAFDFISLSCDQFCFPNAALWLETDISASTFCKSIKIQEYTKKRQWEKWNH